MKKTIVLLVLCVCSLSYAAGAGLTEETWSFIKLQIMNFSVFAIAIVALIKFKINPVLETTREDFLAQSMEAERKLNESKAARNELRVKLQELEDNYTRNIEKAKSQSKQKHDLKIQETQQQVAALAKDLTSQLENLKRGYASSLRHMLTEQSIAELKEDLGKDVDQTLLVKLQDKFVSSVEARV